MFDLDRWQEILATLRSHLLRTLLTAFGVFWGIFMLVLLQGSGNGLENGVLQQFGNQATNSFFVWGQRTTQAFSGLQPGRQVRFVNADMQAVRTQLKSYISAVTTRSNAGGQSTTSTVVYKQKTGTFTLETGSPELLLMRPVPILEGRFINAQDVAQYRKICCIGSRVAELLFGKGVSPIGQVIQVGGITFMVVGVFDTFEKGEDAGDALKTVYIPLSTSQRVFNQQYLNNMQVLAAPGVPASLAETKTRELLQARLRIAPSDRSALGSFNLEKEFQKIQGLFTGIRIFLWIVGTGTLVAGIVGVGNIMIITVQERTKEIGVRKAIGATPWSVISQILQESVLLTAFSGLMGLTAGVFLLEGVNKLLSAGGQPPSFFVNPTVNFSLAIAATALLVGAGALAGLLPALRASRIQPIEALRAD